MNQPITPHRHVPAGDADAHHHDHDHDHGHGHHHGHHHHGVLDPGAIAFGRAFVLGVSLNLLFVVLELGFGYLASSLALIADAGHNFGDVLGLVLAWGAAWLAQRQPSPRFTYGWRGATILAALANALLLLIAIAAIIWGAVMRLRYPEMPDGWVVIWVALAGVVVNGVTAWLFMAGRKSDLNIRGAFLHMAADAVISLAVALAGAGMLLTGWTWLDPVVSLAVAIAIFFGTWGLLRDSVRLALQAVPDGIDVEAVRAFLGDQPGVSGTHDLHVWAMSTTETALTAHLVMRGGHPGDDCLAEIAAEISLRFGINHTTLQIETGTGEQPCVLTHHA